MKMARAVAVSMFLLVVVRSLFSSLFTYSYMSFNGSYTLLVRGNYIFSRRVLFLSKDSMDIGKLLNDN
jgi:hypothetical protein